MYIKQWKKWSVPYDYKEAYDKVHYDWMPGVYKWIGILGNVITRLSSLMGKWKAGLEIWKNEESIIRWIDITCVFLQGDSHLPIAFLYLKSQYVYFNNPKDTI